MPISGLLITLSEDPGDAVAQIAGHGGFTPGPREARRLAATLATDDADEDRAAWLWINDLPGVVHVDVVFVGFDDPATPTLAPAPTFSEPAP